MNNLPEFWRTEVWHPLSVHFPVAILLLATFFKLISLLSKRIVWNHGGSIMLITGTLAAWIAVYTGNLADGAVSRTICDPTVLKSHENAAYTMSWLFTGAAALDLIYQLKNFSFNKMLLVLTILLMLTGSGFLSYAGHLGASLVYQQGAGVYKPTEDCSEFE